jgi:hypothetical protein
MPSEKGFHLAASPPQQFADTMQALWFRRGCLSLIRRSNRHQPKLGVQQTTQAEVAFVQMTVNLRRIGNIQLVSRYLIDIKLMEMLMLNHSLA